MNFVRSTLSGLLFAALAVPLLTAQDQVFPIKHGQVSGALSVNLDAPLAAAGKGTVSKQFCFDGTNLSGNIQINCDSTFFPHNEASIAVDPANPQHLVAGSNDYEISFVGRTSVVRLQAGYYTSFDGGATWINGHLDPGGLQSSGDPGVVFNQKFQLVHYANAGYEFGQGGLTVHVVTAQVNTSSDGGVTFGKPAVVSHGLGSNGVELVNDKPSIAVDNSPSSPYYGRVYVGITLFQFGVHNSYIQAPIVVSYSDDGGQHFTTPVVASGSASFCVTGACRDSQASSIQVGGDGTVYVAFENFDTVAENQFLLVRSTDGGVSFSNPVQVVPAVFDDPCEYPLNVQGIPTLSNSQFRVNAYGNLVVDPASGARASTTLYYVFSDNRNGTFTSPCVPADFGNATTNTDVFIVKSTDGGLTWGAVTSVATGSATDNDQFYPWAAVGPTGTVYVRYSDRSYDPANVQYGQTLAASTDGGATFTLSRVDTALSNPADSLWFVSPAAPAQTVFLGDYDGLAVGTDGIPHPIWTDMRHTVLPSPPFPLGGKTEDIVTTSVQ
jgi:hypothetical protein